MRVDEFYYLAAKSFTSFDHYSSGFCVGLALASCIAEWLFEKGNFRCELKRMYVRHLLDAIYMSRERWGRNNEVTICKKLKFLFLWLIVRIGPSAAAMACSTYECSFFFFKSWLTPYMYSLSVMTDPPKTLFRYLRPRPDECSLQGWLKVSHRILTISLVIYYRLPLTALVRDIDAS